MERDADKYEGLITERPRAVKQVALSANSATARAHRRRRNSTTELTESPEGKNGIISAMAATCAARDKDRILSRQQQIRRGTLYGD